jgi:GNAT superfamily N-acetyltransferase
VARSLVDVRRATVDDLTEILDLWSQGREEVARLGRPTVAAEQVRSRLTEAVASGQVEILLARREGRPAGFLILRRSPLSFVVEAPALCIDQLYVAADARRLGVARAMLSHVPGRAERLGAEQIVTSVAPWARDMHRFFARLGFSPVTVRRSVSPAVLRRRLTGEQHRGALEDLLSRRRSLRARARRRPPVDPMDPEETPPPVAAPATT